MVRDGMLGTRRSGGIAFIFCFERMLPARKIYDAGTCRRENVFDNEKTRAEKSQEGQRMTTVNITKKKKKKKQESGT